MSWNKKMIDLSEHIATWSKDKSTKVGCVIADTSHRVLSTGYNGFPIGINDNIEERFEKPEKYKYTEHAERNAIYAAAKNGVALNGSMIFVSWFPCVECARAIIQSGIYKIVCKKPDFENENWNFKTSEELLREAGVCIEWYEEDDDSGRSWYIELYEDKL